MEKEKYYSIYFDWDFCFYMVKGTYNAAKKYGEILLKEEYGIRETDLPSFINEDTGENITSYQELMHIEEDDTETFIDLIYEGCYDDMPETADPQWILEHRDDFYILLNQDGTCKRTRLL